LTEAIKEELGDPEMLIPNLPLRWIHLLDLEVVSRQLAARIAHTVTGRSFKRIILIGHSAGGVLVQSAFLDLQKISASIGLPPLRLVLIAPLTRGWMISHHIPFFQKLAWTIGIYLSRWIRWMEDVRAKVSGQTPRPMWILQIERGAPFIVGLRLRWLEYSGPRPVIYTLLGSRDEIISWRDMVDEVMDRHSHYREVPYSNHVEIVDVTDECHGGQRRRIIANALNEDPEAAAPETSFVPYDFMPANPEEDVKRVVFVMHGIRDEGHWTQKIAARARRFSLEVGEKIAVETSSYGYFSILEFIFPSARLKKIHWLMDEYVEARRRYPNARFSYIGHSNGTYLLAQALKMYPGVRFERIAFAGSVVSSNYDWRGLMVDRENGEKRQVEAVLNFVAHGDLVVSLFPRLADISPIVQRLIGPNLGGAGVVPFPQVEGVTSNKYVIGGHSSAIGEWNWDHLARFAVSEPIVIPKAENLDGENVYRRTASFACDEERGPWVSIGILLFILGVLGYLGFLAGWRPAMFWPVPVLLLGVVIPCIVGYSSLAEGVTFAERKKILKRSGLMFIILMIVILLWIAAIPITACFGASTYVDGDPPEVWQFLIGRQTGSPVGWAVFQTLSVVVFLKGVWTVLTKV